MFLRSIAKDVSISKKIMPRLFGLIVSRFCFFIPYIITPFTSSAASPCYVTLLVPFPPFSSLFYFSFSFQRIDVSARFSIHRHTGQPPPRTTTVQYLYYPNRTLPGNTDMIAIPFIYLWLYDRAPVYATLGTYQNRRLPCTEDTEDTVIIFSDKPTISFLSSTGVARRGGLHPTLFLPFPFFSFLAHAPLQVDTCFAVMTKEIHVYRCSERIGSSLLATQVGAAARFSAIRIFDDDVSSKLLLRVECESTKAADSRR